MAFLRRKPRPVVAQHANQSLHEIGRRWNGLEWGCTTDQFMTAFPGGGISNGEWWQTGQGPEAFCGVTMTTQYAFNRRGEFCLVSFIPEVADRSRLSVAVLNELGAPDGTAFVWRTGHVEIEVKVAGIMVTMTHRRLAQR